MRVNQKKHIFVSDAGFSLFARKKYLCQCALESKRIKNKLNEQINGFDNIQIAGKLMGPWHFIGALVVLTLTAAAAGESTNTVKTGGPPSQNGKTILK